MSKKYIKILIGIILFAIIIILILLNILKNKDNETSNNETVNEEEIIESVKNDNDFYMAEESVNLYLDAINKQKLTDLGIENDNDSIKSYNESIVSILDKNYVEENKITTENVRNYVNKINANVIYTTIEYKKNSDEDNIEKYIFHGFCQDLDYNYINDLYLIVNIDLNTNSYSIKPILNANNIENIEFSSIDEIESNEYNEITENEINDEYVANEYFNRFRNIFILKSELSYNILDEEYRNKKFADIKDYQDYNTNNKEIFKNIELSKFKKYNENTDVPEYICIDQYGNYYIFKDKGVMDYTVMLDTYTIDSEEFTNKYNEGSEQLKVGMNLEKVFQALNRKDYTYIYGKLDDNFKQNYFPTTEDFESYMKNTFFEINKATYGEFEEKSGVYVYKVELSDATQSNQENDENDEETSSVIKSFIVKLEDNNDYKLAFNVN